MNSSDVFLIRNQASEQKVKDILTYFPLTEGYNYVYYGKIRNGKTRTATADILNLLDRGELVVANWNISWDGMDEREHFGIVLRSFLFGRRTFFVYGKKNFTYIDPDGLITGEGEFNIAFLNKLVGVHLFIDEGQWVLPSLDRAMTPENMDKMRLVLHGGHYCRSLNIITQRAENISKNTRSQINVWYRCTKRIETRWFIVFQRWAIEDTKESLPIDFETDLESGKEKPLGDVKTYFAWKKSDRVFNSYNTHGMRSKEAILFDRDFEIHHKSFKERFGMVIAPLRRHARKRKGLREGGGTRNEEDVGSNTSNDALTN